MSIIAKVYYPEFIDLNYENELKISKNIGLQKFSPITTLNKKLNSGYSCLKQIDGEIRRLIVSNKNFEQFKNIVKKYISIPILYLNELNMKTKINIDYLIHNMSQNNYKEWYNCRTEEDWIYIQEKYNEIINKNKNVVLRIRITVEYENSEQCETNRLKSKGLSSKELIDSLYSQMINIPNYKL
jgi:hypothetical protein